MRVRKFAEGGGHDRLELFRRDSNQNPNGVRSEAASIPIDIGRVSVLTWVNKLGMKRHHFIYVSWGPI